MLEKGLIQVYTGDGKGKTTAALGLALRAAGHGNKVLIYQFLKPSSLETGERFALQSQTADISIKTLDLPWDMDKSFQDVDAVSKMQAAISDCLHTVAKEAGQKLYDVIILDEIVFCLSKNLASLEDVRSIIENRASGVEIIMTGRGATVELIELADLVTEMKNIRHPFDKGINARKGIEF